MKKADKIRFVKNLTGSIKDEIISKIESDKIPENWDGIELRKILAEKFTSEANYMSDKRSKRYKDYENDVLINNI